MGDIFQVIFYVLNYKKILLFLIYFLNIYFNFGVVPSYFLIHFSLWFLVKFQMYIRFCLHFSCNGIFILICAQTISFYSWEISQRPFFGFGLWIIFWSFGGKKSRWLKDFIKLLSKEGFSLFPRRYLIFLIHRRVSMSICIQCDWMKLLFSKNIDIKIIMKIIDIFNDSIWPWRLGISANSFENKRSSRTPKDIRVILRESWVIQRWIHEMKR